MDMSEVNALPMQVKFLGQPVNFQVRLDALDDDFNEWLNFQGPYKDDKPEQQAELDAQWEMDAANAEEGKAPPRPKRFRSNTEIICRVVEGWDITNKGQPVPVTEEEVAPLMLTFKSIVVQEIFGLLDSKKLSETPSRWRGGSARKAK